MKVKSGNKKRKRKEYLEALWQMLPAVLIAGIVPLIVRVVARRIYLETYPWYPTVRKEYEFFLAAKSAAMTALLVVMLVLIAYRSRKDKKVVFANWMIPLAVYLLFAFLSSVFAINTKMAFNGGYSQYESFWVMMAYVFSVYFIFSYAKTETELRVVVDAICFSAGVIGILGALQGIGIDIFNMPIIQKLITSKENLQALGGKIEIMMEKGVAYATLYNPNYLGVYGSFLLPFLAMLVLFEKSLWRRLVQGGIFVLVAIAMLSSRSRAGLIATGVSLAVAAVICFRPMIKYWYLTIPAANLIVVILLLVNAYNDNAIFGRLQAAFEKESKRPVEEEMIEGVLVKKTGLTQLFTGKNGVFFEYNQVKAQIGVYVEDTIYGIYALDENEDQIELNPNEDGTEYRFTHPALLDLRVLPQIVEGEEDGASRLFVAFKFVAGSTWQFIYLDSVGEYQYITAFGKLSEMVSSEGVGFEDRQSLFSNRGFIWSRSIPLLKKHIAIGCGPDNFLLAFPQNDYLAMYKHGFANAVMTKPHSMYLQIGVQTGVISLLAVLVFYGWYFVQSIRLYFFRALHSLAECFGVASLIGSIGYMISGLSNDSMVVTAPVFWVMLGVGFAANAIVKKQRKGKNA